MAERPPVGVDGIFRGFHSGIKKILIERPAVVLRGIFDENRRIGNARKFAAEPGALYDMIGRSGYVRLDRGEHIAVHKPEPKRAAAAH